MVYLIYMLCVSLIIILSITLIYIIKKRFVFLFCPLLALWIWMIISVVLFYKFFLENRINSIGAILLVLEQVLLGKLYLNVLINKHSNREKIYFFSAVVAVIYVIVYGFTHI